MTTVIDFPGATRLDSHPERVLDLAAAADLTGVVVIGWERTETGDEVPWYASSLADAADVTWLLRHWELRLHGVKLEGDDT